MSQKCEKCNGPTVALFSSVVCRSDCDRNPGLQKPDPYRFLIGGLSLTCNWDETRHAWIPDLATADPEDLAKYPAPSPPPWETEPPRPFAPYPVPKSQWELEQEKAKP